MSTDLLVSLIIILVSALILHLKSHVKFIALGLFIGLVLAETLGGGLHEWVIARWPDFDSQVALSTVKLSLLLIPALILGINHTVDKHGKWGFLRTIVFVAVTTMFLLTSTVSLLPPDLRQEIAVRSIIAAQFLYFQRALVVGVAVLIVFDSFHHKAAIKKLRQGH